MMHNSHQCRVFTVYNSSFCTVFTMNNSRQCNLHIAQFTPVQHWPQVQCTIQSWRISSFLSLRPARLHVGCGYGGVHVLSWEEKRLNENLAAASVHLCLCTGQGCNQQAAGMWRSSRAPCSFNSTCRCSTNPRTLQWSCIHNAAGCRYGRSSGAACSGAAYTMHYMQTFTCSRFSASVCTAIRRLQI